MVGLLPVLLVSFLAQNTFQHTASGCRQGAGCCSPAPPTCLCAASSVPGTCEAPACLGRRRPSCDHPARSFHPHDTLRPQLRDVAYLREPEIRGTAAVALALATLVGIARMIGGLGMGAGVLGTERTAGPELQPLCCCLHAAEPPRIPCLCCTRSICSSLCAPLHSLESERFCRTC